jgi:hypothetical protein
MLQFQLRATTTPNIWKAYWYKRQCAILYDRNILSKQGLFYDSCITKSDYIGRHIALNMRTAAGSPIAEKDQRILDMYCPQLSQQHSTFVKLRSTRS